MAAALTLVTIALLAGRSWAPIFDPFPGFSKLIDSSDYIVVVSILQQGKENGFDGWSKEKIHVLAVIKGDIQPGLETTASLRNLGLRTGRVSTKTILEQDFRPGERFVLFLVKNRDRKGGSPIESENSCGNSFWVAPSSDLSKLKPNDVRGNITQLLADVVAHEKSQLRDLEATIAGYLEDK